MAEYKLANGGVLTDEDIDRICKEFETESWAGRLQRIHQGPAAVADEPLVTVTVKIPQSMVEAIDERAQNRSDFIRRAIAAAL
ncbi:ribbon-helix-helix domain-containing protein [Thermophilibacter provencensis]|uniref:ribbon-helix-helix domain-containing protein n=1 Tax=Thermophilibacter provencensis TaxID=1852386 RepID=UPI00094AA9B2|nr:ribbon-helix-helix domain-containing protein [Thermophilibacter provencensis]